MKKEVVELLAKSEVGKHLKKEDILSCLEVPPRSELGDFAFPCFKLSSAYKKNPVEIAKQLEKELKIKSKLKNSIYHIIDDYSIIFLH